VCSSDLDRKTDVVTIGKWSGRGRGTFKEESVSIEDLKRASADIHLTMLKMHDVVTGKAYAPLWNR